MTYETYKLDTQEQVFFYEQDFYVLSNFSAFTLLWKGIRFPTVEVAYHWEKFHNHPDIQAELLNCTSSHDAFALAQKYKHLVWPRWDELKVITMEQLLWAKVEQHPYVRRKLLATGNRELVEDSWRDTFWGWGPNKDGRNELGKLWMKIREGVRNEVS